MINKNEYHLMCFLLINSLFQLKSKLGVGQTCLLSYVVKIDNLTNDLVDLSQTTTRNMETKTSFNT